MKLSNEQVERVREYVEQSGIHLQTLQEDVLDHLCCVLEDTMDSPVDFENHLREAAADLSPGGLGKLEREAMFLLNSKKLIYMKKLMYLVGLGSSIALAMGICFKLLHWQGGDELITYGFISFTLLFLPMTMIDRFKVKIQKSLSERLRFILGALSAIFTGLAVVMKILHLQGADYMLLIGAVMFSFGFLPFLFFTNYRKAVGQHL